MQVLRYALNPEGFDPDSGEQFDPSDGFIAKVTLPENATLLPTVAFTTKGITIYAVADPDAAEGDEREFFVVPNGKDLPEQIANPHDAAISFRGTAKPMPGSPTFHVFELAKVVA